MGGPPRSAGMGGPPRSAGIGGRAAALAHQLQARNRHADHRHPDHAQNRATGVSPAGRASGACTCSGAIARRQGGKHALGR